LNNNRGNNRRRGRGNNRQQGGGQQLNRIDSRARGNAPQLLEKYRKMAHDAHLNGDRVTEEYYLQFADHYFRVLADQRTRQEEQRQQRQAGQGQDRWQDGDNDRYDSDSSGEYGDADYPASPYNYGERREREEAPPRHEEREEVAAPEQRSEAAVGERETPSVYEPAENPFTRDNNRGPRGLKPRRPRRETATGGEAENYQRDEAPSQLDLAVLPPAISPREEVAHDEPEAAVEAKPKRRTTRRKPTTDDGDALQAAS
jgi:hypothetical protein